jgi:hypothetical protein
VTISRVPEDTQPESELTRRLRAVERRERELEQALAAVSAQRERLAAIQAEYEQRREGLVERTREAQIERELLREERARIIAAGLAQTGTDGPVWLGPA